MKKNEKYNLICFVVCCQMLNAQVDVKFNPSGEKLTEIAEYKKSTSAILPAKILPKFNLDSVLQEDAKRMDTGIPFRYGYKFDVSYSTLNSGEWQVENGMAIWQLRVKSSNAYSLSFHFSKFYLPETASLIIYNDDQGQMLKEKKTKLKGNEYRINTSGWKEGVYIVRANHKGKVLTEKLVVKE